MNKIAKFSILLPLLLFLVSAPLVGHAQESTSTLTPPAIEKSVNPTMKERMKNVGAAAGFTTDESIASAPRIVGVIISAFISFTGLIFIALMVIAGYGWMTSNGNEEKIKKSVSTIKASVIGLIVALSAWAVWNLIFERIIMG